MEEIKVKELSNEELIQLENKIQGFLKKLEADYNETKNKGGK